jgi:hypothetical protein
MEIDQKLLEADKLSHIANPVFECFCHDDFRNWLRPHEFRYPSQRIRATQWPRSRILSAAPVPHLCRGKGTDAIGPRTCSQAKWAKQPGKPNRTEEEEYAGRVDPVADDIDSDALGKSADDSDYIRYCQWFLFWDLIAFVEEVCLVQWKQIINQIRKERGYKVRVSSD